MDIRHNSNVCVLSGIASPRERCPCPVGTFARYMHNNRLGQLYNILYAAIAAHAAEAIYTFYVCRKKGFAMFSTFLWTTQTFVFGFPSLLALKAYKGSIILKTQ
ncbi:hypothetical protein DPMN_136523 [Dreissena polymorpha]|uniref:Transmembrane protein 254 n=1 Tax=Dreissena polymorpha TaxID=45954 RepID=A0A9D4G609_DREPO|nr:hypothetical protein DPMN_136523 [Dreissena polymorpha]